MAKLNAITVYSMVGSRWRGSSLWYIYTYICVCVCIWIHVSVLDTRGCYAEYGEGTRRIWLTEPTTWHHGANSPTILNKRIYVLNLGISLSTTRSTTRVPTCSLREFVLPRVVDPAWPAKDVPLHVRRGRRVNRSIEGTIKNSKKMDSHGWSLLWCLLWRPLPKCHRCEWWVITAV